MRQDNTFIQFLFLAIWVVKKLYYMSGLNSIADVQAMFLFFFRFTDLPTTFWGIEKNESGLFVVMSYQHSHTTIFFTNNLF